MNTLFLLMADFGSTDIPLRECCSKYFGVGERKIIEHARLQQLLVPCYRGGSQKKRMVHQCCRSGLSHRKAQRRRQHDRQRLNG